MYVKMAPGYEELDVNGFSMVVRILKALYGLHQSSSHW